MGSHGGYSCHWLCSLQRWFYCNRSLACGRVFETYCDRMGINLGAVKFLYKGDRIYGADTPAALQVGARSCAWRGSSVVARFAHPCSILQGQMYVGALALPS